VSLCLRGKASVFSCGKTRLTNRFDTRNVVSVNQDRLQLPSTRVKSTAFTLIELLVVIFILVVLSVILIPAFYSRPQPAYRVHCLNNQKQIALGLIMWNSDNTNQFPWQVASTNGGALEAAARGYAAANFKCLESYIRSMPVFICPTDTNRVQAVDYSQFKNRNVSYFVSLDGGTNPANSILTGDRHLASNGKPVNPGLFTYTTNSIMNWTHELHANVKNQVGVLSFADGHCEVVRDTGLGSIFQREGLATNRLAVP
jgi:prepilin-type N-terminal cleavage/methylation domain-containing protein